MGVKVINCNADGSEAVSPLGQTFSTSSLSVCIQAIFELEEHMDVFAAKKAIHDILLPSNPRFCSIMKDKRGGLHWVKTKVKVDEHVIVPEFPPGQTEYDGIVNDYICNIHLAPLPKNRPLWEFHILNYNTSKARATIIINMHHSLGDGTSLMSLLLSCITRAHDPHLPLTFPSSKSTMPHKPSPPCYSWVSTKFMYNMLHRLFVLVLVLWYTLCDFIGSLLRINWMDDSKIHIRGPPGVEMLPKVMTHATFPMEDIKKIKNSIGGTVNDVIMGLIFHGLQRYLQNTHSHGENEKVRVTAIVTMNTRLLSGLKDIKEMMKAESGSPWGNRFGLLHVPITMHTATVNVGSPLDSVRRAKKILDRKKMSLEVFLTSRLLAYLGRQASAFCVYKTLTNATLGISNMVGPTEKIAMNQVPVKNMFFSISGLPQTLLLTVVSYMGSVRLEVIGVKGYVDCESLAECFGECFEEMRNASMQSIR